VEQSRARALEATALYRGAVLRAFGEVETNLATVDARERQRIAVERLVAANADTVRLARTRYRAGLTDFLPVLDAERTLLRSRDQLAAVEAEAADAELALFGRSGGITARVVGPGLTRARAAFRQRQEEALARIKSGPT
jgi:outer membrane protein TolC